MSVTPDIFFMKFVLTESTGTTQHGELREVPKKNQCRQKNKDIELSNYPTEIKQRHEDRELFHNKN